jgi:hypothetical protein
MASDERKRTVDAAAEQPIGELLVSEHSETALADLKSLVQNAVGLRRNVIVYTLARKIFAALESVGAGGARSLPIDTSTWTKIESLSQLRTVVGGRFQNLKERWIAAGLPLREHRGDRKEQARLNFDGWMELAAWVSRQGFEVRLAEENEQWLFEIRQADSRPG